jgi:hypothetical protein
MSNEITFNSSVSIQKTDSVTGKTQVKYLASAPNPSIDLAGAAGPYVGTLNVPTSGLNVDLSGAGTPGMAVLFNHDATNSVDWGIKDDATGKFYPLGRLLPGMLQPVYLSPHIGVDEASGAGSTSAGTTHLYLKAYGATCKVQVDVFPA